MARRRALAAFIGLLAAAAMGVVSTPAYAAAGDIVEVSGTVLTDQGEPVAYQFVTMSAWPGSFASAMTDEFGNYSLVYTMAGDYELPTLRGGNSPASWVCDPIGPLTGPATITANCVAPAVHQLTVTGTATTDNGKPIGMSRFVNAQDPLGLGRVFGSGVLADDGSYTLEITYTGEVDSIDILDPNYAVAATVTGFASGDVITGVDFTYHPAAEYAPYPVTVHGKVTDKKGRPIAGAEVVLGAGPANVTGSATTAADGTYSLVGETWWNDEVLDGSDAFVTIDGVKVALLSNMPPEADYAVDYRIGKTKVFEPYLSDVDYFGNGEFLVDVERKLNSDGQAEWAFCADVVCQGTVFGTKKAQYLGLSPADAFGISFMVFRDTSTAEAQWLRVDPYQIFLSQASFGPKRLDGYEWFDFQGDGPADLVAWADADGVTTVWTWSSFDASELPTSQQVQGRFVSAEHLNLDAAGGDELILVTRSGKNYTVTLIPSRSDEPVTVATGRGKPTVTYVDPDGDQVFEIVATFPGRN